MTIRLIRSIVVHYSTYQSCFNKLTTLYHVLKSKSVSLPLFGASFVSVFPTNAMVTVATAGKDFNYFQISDVEEDVQLKMYV